MADNGRYHSGGDPDKQGMRQAEQAKEKSIEALSSLVAVKKEGDKSYWMGKEISPEFGDLANYLTSVLPNYISDFLRGGVYEHSKTAFEKLNAEFELGYGSASGRKTGLAASAAVTGLLIGAQPISEVVHGFKERGKKRKEISAELTTVFESDKGAYEHNEVIKTAMERADKNIYLGMKQALALIPSVLVNGFYAMEGHKEFARSKSGDVSLANSGLDPVARERQIMQEERAKKDKLEADAKRLSDSEKIDLDVARTRLETRAKEDAKIKLREEAEERNRQRNRDPNIPENFGKHIALQAAAGFSAMFRKSADNAKKEIKGKHCAYELIENLRKNGGSRGANLTKQIVEIFEQNEIDRGRSGIGEAMMEKFQPLAERIAEVIAKKEIDPLALVSLVGDGKVVNKRQFISEDKLEELLDAQRRVFGAHEKTPLDDFLADFQSPKLVMEAIKENLRNLDGNEKAVFASMLSDDVLIHAGVKSKDILELRKAGHDYMYDVIKSTTVELAQKDDEVLKGEGLSEKQIKAVRGLNKLITEGKDKEVKSEIDKGNGVVRASAVARLSEQVKSGKSGKEGKEFWTSIIHKKAPVVVEKQPDMSMVEAVQKGRGGEHSAHLGGGV